MNNRSLSLNAYEDRELNEGIMMTCLKEALHQDVTLDRMADFVKIGRPTIKAQKHTSNNRY